MSKRKPGRPPLAVRKVRVGTLFLLPDEYERLIGCSLLGERAISAAARLLTQHLAMAETEDPDRLGMVDDDRCRHSISP